VNNALLPCGKLSYSNATERRGGSKPTVVVTDDSMSAPLLGALRSIYPSLPAGEQRVADLVLERPEEAALWSGRELARLSGASETVLFRLVRRLGMSGFKEFKLALLREEGANRAHAELGIFNVPFHAGSPLPVQLREVMQAYASNLEATVRLLSDQPLDDVAEALAGATLVTLLGMGASLSVATLAENVLARIGIPCRLSQDSHQQLLQMLQRSERHVVVAFSFSGETRETAESMAVAREAGATTIAMTAFVPSSVADQADLLVRVPVVNPRRYRVGLVDAVLPYLLVLDLIAIRIGSRRDVGPLRERVEATIERRKLRSRHTAANGDR
jgi:DNA-binding MurR/RpiR family transcriptional regulator